MDGLTTGWESESHPSALPRDLPRHAWKDPLIIIIIIGLNSPITGDDYAFHYSFFAFSTALSLGFLPPNPFCGGDGSANFRPSSSGRQLSPSMSSRAATRMPAPVVSYISCGKCPVLWSCPDCHLVRLFLCSCHVFRPFPMGYLIFTSTRQHSKISFLSF